MHRLRSVTEIQTEILHSTFLAILIVAFPTVIANAVQDVRLHHYAFMWVVPVSYLFFLAVYVGRRRLSNRFLTFALIVPIYLIGTLSAMQYGMIGPSVLFFIAICTFSVLLLRRLYVNIIVVVSFVTLIVTQLLWMSDLLEYQFSIEQYAKSEVTFATRSLLAFFWMGILVFSIRKMNGYLANSVELVERTNELMRQKEYVLKQQVEEIQAQKEAISVANRQLEILVESSGDLIYSILPNGMIKTVNEAFERLAGRSRAELIDEFIFDILPSEVDATRLKQAIQLLVQTKESVVGNVSFHNREGQVMTFRVTLTPIMNAAGEVVMMTGQNHNITELMEQKQQIEQLAYIDFLTQLPNRYALKERGNEWLKQQAYVAVVYVDIDNFKTVNDSLGHYAGDEILKLLVEKMTSVFPNREHIYRIGGDEFVILTMLEGATLMRAIETLIYFIQQPVEFEDIYFYLGASVGVATFPHNGRELNELLKNADTAMYKAKTSGKNRYVLYTNELHEEVLTRVRLESLLRNALLHDELYLVYQPIMTRAGKIRGCETLLRWNSAKEGYVSPARFIPILEATGLIVEYGDWVMRQAFHEAQKWQQIFPDPVIISINISPLQFNQDSFIPNFEKLLREFKLPPAIVELEITESIFIENPQQIIQKLEKLRTMGVNIALDDFGTGYSSLNYLKRLPITTLKMDKSFIDDIHESDRERMIVSSIIALAHGMNLEVVAEGVESVEQAYFLAAHHCDYLQGYLYHKPLTALEMKWILIEESGA